MIRESQWRLDGELGEELASTSRTGWGLKNTRRRGKPIAATIPVCLAFQASIRSDWDHFATAPPVGSAGKDQLQEIRAIAALIAQVADEFPDQEPTETAFRQVFQCCRELGKLAFRWCQVRQPGAVVG